MTNDVLLIEGAETLVIADTVPEILEVPAVIEILEVAIQGLPGAVGETGPPGLPGQPGQPGPTGSGGGDLNGSYTQGVPSSAWVISHSLGKYPSVTVIDSAGTLIEGDVSYPDGNTVLIQFASSFAGQAILN